jgi:hypothetical protein
MPARIASDATTKATALKAFFTGCFTDRWTNRLADEAGT